jgi:hypothetical protein
MKDGIIDSLEVINSMVFKDGLMPDVDEEGNLIQSEEQAGGYVKRFKKHIEDGKILRYSMHRQISPLACYKEFDDFINKQRKDEVDSLNEEYYGKEKYLRIKQCM